LAVEASRYYELAVGATDANDYISFFATPIRGSVYLYVGTATKPVRDDPTTYQWSSINYVGGQTVTAHHGERGFCRGCIYYVMVFGRTATNYSVIAQTSKAIVALQNNVPQTSWLQDYSYGYFSFRSDIAKVTISLVCCHMNAYSIDGMLMGLLVSISIGYYNHHSNSTNR
jgi:hypothetical protein